MTKPVLTEVRVDTLNRACTGAFGGTTALLQDKIAAQVRFNTEMCRIQSQRLRLLLAALTTSLIIL